MSEVDFTMDGQLTGQVLRQVREKHGWSRQQVALELKLPQRVITQLEQLENAQIADVYLRGYLRRYARLLGIPTSEKTEPAQAHKVPVAADLLPRPQTVSWKRLFWGVPVAVLAVFLLGERVGRNQPESHSIAATEPMTESAPTVTTPMPQVDPGPEKILVNSMENQQSGTVGAGGTKEAETAQSSMASRLSPIRDANAHMKHAPAIEAVEAVSAEHYILQFKGESWVEVRDARRKRLAYRLFHSGESLVLQGEPPYDLLIGNHKQTVLRIDGRAIDLSAFARGNVVRINTRSLVGEQADSFTNVHHAEAKNESVPAGSGP